MATALEEIREQVLKDGINDPDYSSDDSVIVTGQAYSFTALDSRTALNYTTPLGQFTNMIISFQFYLGKRGFTVEKVENWLEVSPVHQQYYQITIAQKQQLERQIKEGLASIGQSIADLELLLHDLRKYKEFMDYFNAIAKAKKMMKGRKKEEKEDGEKMLEQNEQTLRAIFIDEVDAHTDMPQTPIALRSIVSRWPTIIADFMKLKEKHKDVKSIRDDLKVSEAQAVVLATKNKLYYKWKDVFIDTVKARYQRIRGLVSARQKSVEEYKNMLIPYIMRHRAIKETGETPGGRRQLESEHFKRIGDAISAEYSTVWAWRPFTPPDFFKPTREAVPSRAHNTQRSKIGKGFKIMAKNRIRNLRNRKAYLTENGFLTDERAKEIDDEIKYLSTIPESPSGSEPLDWFVYKYYPIIEKKYEIKFSIKEIFQAREEFVKRANYMGTRKNSSPYFETVEFKVAKVVMKSPNGGEIEDVVLNPFYCYMDTQNFIILRKLEIKAQQKERERYIQEMVARETGGKTIAGFVKGEYPELFGEPGAETEIKDTRYPGPISERINERLRAIGLNLRFFKPGPYETHFEDRITGVWIPEFLGSVYFPCVNFFKAKLGVPGYKVAV